MANLSARPSRPREPHATKRTTRKAAPEKMVTRARTGASHPKPRGLHQEPSRNGALGAFLAKIRGSSAISASASTSFT
eukprot:10028502-Alexandrium_andersonii.AAC.1